MRWSVAEAKGRLSELLRQATREPQTIERRSEPVAVVLSGEAFADFQAWRAEASRRSVGQAFEELRTIAKASRYRLRIPARKDRRDSVAAFGE